MSACRSVAPVVDLRFCDRPFLARDPRPLLANLPLAFQLVARFSPAACPLAFRNSAHETLTARPSFLCAPSSDGLPICVFVCAVCACRGCNQALWGTATRLLARPSGAQRHAPWHRISTDAEELRLLKQALWGTVTRQLWHRDMPLGTHTCIFNSVFPAFGWRRAVAT